MRLTAILAIIIFLCLIAAVVAAPLLPSEFYGAVTINGAPAPAGTVINATINGLAAGSFVTLSPGVYGGPGTFDSRLSVSGTENGQSVAFFINGEEADQTSIFHAGTTQRLDLTIVNLENTSATNVSTTLSETSTLITTQPTGEVTMASSTSVTTQPTGEITPVATMTTISTVSPVTSSSVPETQAQITVRESGQQTAVPTSIRATETASVTPTPGFTLQSCGIAGILLMGGYGLLRRRT